ncbi:MAG TPA: hypothetical protein VFX52_06445 [Nocardioidaceae bacterium]|nr:hypothetical protein [Nocardioidaceae bacterium]
MPTEPRGRGWARGLLVVGVLSLALVAGLVVLFNRGVGPLPDPEGCQARVGGVVVDLTTEQAENAATIAAVAVGRGLPARAASIALATAMQESKLRNLDHGDRDSLGLFQQRPSMGWGTAREIRDPYYAANRFYDALVKIDGYQSMRITEAAQEVQRSGFPEAYQDHAADGRALASALTGYSPGRFGCVARPATVGSQQPGAGGLTPRARRVRRALEHVFGPQQAGGLAEQGRTLDLLVRPAATAQDRRQGWAMASYLVAQADRLHIARVVFDRRSWRSGTGSQYRWHRYPPAGSSGHRTALEYLDRVHVTVL